MFCSGSTIYHVGGRTLNKLSPQKTFLNFRNNLILLFKNHASQYFVIKLFIRFVLDGIAGVKFLLSGEMGHFLAVIKAHFNFYASLPKTLSKRKQLKQQIKQYTTSAVYLHCVIADYFLRGKKTFKEIDIKGRFLQE